MSSENNKQDWIESKWEYFAEDYVSSLSDIEIVEYLYDCLDKGKATWKDREDFSVSMVSDYETQSIRYGEYLARKFDDLPTGPEEDEHERGIE